LRPILNLKQKKDYIRLSPQKWRFWSKKYRGSLSGEHGDGIVRGEFCLYDWRQNYELLKRIKLAFDPNSVLNMGKLSMP
jgi:FAD/FMN-containing dehydrogenase